MSCLIRIDQRTSAGTVQDAITGPATALSEAGKERRNRTRSNEARQTGESEKGQQGERYSSLLTRRGTAALSTCALASWRLSCRSSAARKCHGSLRRRPPAVKEPPANDGSRRMGAVAPGGPNSRWRISGHFCYHGCSQGLRLSKVGKVVSVSLNMRIVYNRGLGSRRQLS